jgi:hypothetical protein
LDRRFFVGAAAAAGVAVVLGGAVAGCSGDATTPEEPADGGTPGSAADSPDAVGPAGQDGQGGTDAPASLPPAAPDPDDQFGIDLTVNMDSIEDYLGRPDVAYRDVRMLFDPARYEDIGGDSELSFTLTGFKVVPYPYLATVSELPVEGAYAGPALYSLTWAEDGSIAAAVPNYQESRLVLDDLFPADKAVFLMCGAGGYAASTRSLLAHLGWDEGRLYNIGAAWTYAGPYQEQLVIPGAGPDAPATYATWRADYALIDFERLHPA